MNILRSEKQEMVIKRLVEGSSIRSIERMTGVHRDTIMRLMVSVGNTCEKLMDTTMRNLTCKDIEVDEVWSFVGKKQRHVGINDDPNKVGDFYTFIALDADTKLIPVYRVGKRDLPTAQAFISDLSSRLSNRIQISSDKLKAYVDAIEVAFGANVDYAQIVKSYEAEPIGPGRYRLKNKGGHSTIRRMRNLQLQNPESTCEDPHHAGNGVIPARSRRAIVEESED